MRQVKTQQKLIIELTHIFLQNLMSSVKTKLCTIAASELLAIYKNNFNLTDNNIIKKSE